MIDWLKIVVPLRHTDGKPPPNGGMTIRTDSDGEILYQHSNALRVVGSHDSSIGVIARGDGFMTVDGNPSKFLQGHNVFGPECVRELALRLAFIGADALDVKPTIEDLEDWTTGNIELKTIDVTYSVALQSRGQVLALLKQMEQTATFRHRGRGQLTKGTTLYFGKNSTRSSFKLYSKGEEINAPKHQLHPRLLVTDLGKFLLEFADPLLRTELRMRAPELKRKNLNRVHNWNIETVRRTHNEFWKKLTMSNAITDIDKAIEELPNTLRAIAKLHLKGEDTRNLCGRATWYRHRKALMDYGIDLATNNGNLTKTRRIEIIDEEPIVLRFDYNNQIPEFVQGTDLDPSKYVEGNMENDGIVPHDIALRYPEHFTSELAYYDSIGEDQLDLFH